MRRSLRCRDEGVSHLLKPLAVAFVLLMLVASVWKAKAHTEADITGEQKSTEIKKDYTTSEGTLATPSPHEKATDTDKENLDKVPEVTDSPVTVESHTQEHQTSEPMAESNAPHEHNHDESHEHIALDDEHDEHAGHDHHHDHDAQHDSHATHDDEHDEHAGHDHRHDHDAQHDLHATHDDEHNEHAGHDHHHDHDAQHDSHATHDDEHDEHVGHDHHHDHDAQHDSHATHDDEHDEHVGHDHRHDHDAEYEEHTTCDDGQDGNAKHDENDVPHESAATVPPTVPPVAEGASVYGKEEESVITTETINAVTDNEHLPANNGDANDGEDAKRPAVPQEVDEEALTDAAAIRKRAQVLPAGCAKTVEQYLFRIHEGRRNVEAHCTAARGALNEARLHKTETVSKAEEDFQRCEAQLWAFDAETLSLYGANLPKTCIAEVEAYMDRQPVPTSDNQYVLAYTYFYHIVVAHARTIYLTMKGVYSHTVLSYVPMVEAIQRFTDTFSDKARKLYHEANPSSGESVLLQGKVLKSCQSLVYAAVPIAVMGTLFVLCLALAPVLIAGLICSELIYHVWIKLFVCYFAYGSAFPADALKSIRDLLRFAEQGKWSHVSNHLIEKFFDLGMEEMVTPYNGFLGVYFVFIVGLFCFFMAYWWIRCLVPGRRKEYKEASFSSKPTVSAATKEKKRK